MLLAFPTVASVQSNSATAILSPATQPVRTGVCTSFWMYKSRAKFTEVLPFVQYIEGFGAVC
jgi:hypothetical protein